MVRFMAVSARCCHGSAGSWLWQVVVDAEATARALLARGQLRARVTIIPLNKASAASRHKPRPGQQAHRATFPVLDAQQQARQCRHMESVLNHPAQATPNQPDRVHAAGQAVNSSWQGCPDSSDGQL